MPLWRDFDYFIHGKVHSSQESLLMQWSVKNFTFPCSNKKKKETNSSLRPKTKKDKPVSVSTVEMPSGWLRKQQQTSVFLLKFLNDRLLLKNPHTSQDIVA